MKTIEQRILDLKTEQNAVILAHNYQLPEVQDIADIVGDSLELARQATSLSAETVIFAGVRFMAETAKILCPDKTVLLPEEDAGCPLADMIEPGQLIKLKEQYPSAEVVSYINSNIEIKALSDLCCTSANALDIVEKANADQIIFIPDKNLGTYIQQFTKKELIFHKGFCVVHDNLNPSDILKIKKNHPEADVIAHPECPMSVIKIADSVESTGGMLRYIKNSVKKEFIIATEAGMNYRLKKSFPDRIFYSIQPEMICENMKKTTLSSILHSLEKKQFNIDLEASLMNRARRPLQRMIEI